MYLTIQRPKKLVLTKCHDSQQCLSQCSQRLLHEHPRTAAPFMGLARPQCSLPGSVGPIGQHHPGARGQPEYSVKLTLIPHQGEDLRLEDQLSCSLGTASWGVQYRNYHIRASSIFLTDFYFKIYVDFKTIQQLVL